MGYIIIILLIYSIFRYRTLYTDSSDGHHKYCKSYDYVDIRSGDKMKLNDDWYAKGTETQYGVFAHGYIDFINSFRKDAKFRYISIMMPIPGDKEIGIDLGIVTGYKDYKKGFYVDQWLLGICPKMRWTDSRISEGPERWICVRQFGSASIRTYGSINI